MDLSIYPIRISKQKHEKHIGLLYILDEETNKRHYVFMKDFDRLMFGLSNHKEKKDFCMHCLQYFYEGWGTGG